MDSKQYRRELRKSRKFLESLQGKVTDDTIEATLGEVARQVMNTRKRDSQTARQHAFMVAASKEVLDRDRKRQDSINELLSPDSNPVWHHGRRIR